MTGTEVVGTVQVVLWALREQLQRHGETASEGQSHIRAQIRSPKHASNGCLIIRTLSGITYPGRGISAVYYTTVCASIIQSGTIIALLNPNVYSNIHAGAL